MIGAILVIVELDIMNRAGCDLQHPSHICMLRQKATGCQPEWSFAVPAYRTLVCGFFIIECLDAIIYNIKETIAIKKLHIRPVFTHRVSIP